MFYWCLKIPKRRLALIARARPQEMANPMEDFMHHITFAKLVILCVYVCVFKRSSYRWFMMGCSTSLTHYVGVFLTVLLSTVYPEPNTICEIRLGKSSELA